MNLLVDIGNSRVKWAQQSDTCLQLHGACFYNKDLLRESIAPHWGSLSRPEQVLIANVAGDRIANEVSAYLHSKWGITPTFLSVARKATGVTNAYEHISQLGIDRWLAMIAAWNRYQSALCIVDCGTALTVDVVMASGQHAGGFIVPGLSLMKDVLNSHTQQINAVLERSPSLELGCTTEDCISNGALMAVTSLILQVLARVSAAYGEDSRCIMTGGYAEEIKTVLAADIDYDPHLVLNGIAITTENV